MADARLITYLYYTIKLRNNLVQEILTEYELIVDSSEQPRERPGEYKEQKKYFSGKKKNHTFKNQIIILPDGQDIVDVIAGKPGPKSDINLFREGKKGFQYCSVKGK